MKNILVALDGSGPANRALAVAVDLAVRYGSALHLVHVIPRPLVVSEELKDFARTEGVLPAPEAAHAIRAVIDEAVRCKVSGERKVIVFNLCGHGHFDLSAYERYLTGKLEDFEYPTEQVRAALAGLPKVSA